MKQLHKSLNSYKTELQHHKNNLLVKAYCKEKIVATTPLERYAKKVSKYSDNVFINKIYEINDNALHMVNEQVKEKETNTKNKIINQVYRDNRKLGNVFYIASSHEDCAEDHKDFQGKVYVDRYCGDKEALQYAREHNIRTIQWVLKKPVWLVTRPNCRHYMVGTTKDKIISGKYTIPHTQIGRESMRTPKQVTLEYLKDRLELLTQMYKAHPTSMLQNKILKTRLLIDKWSRK